MKELRFRGWVSGPCGATALILLILFICISGIQAMEMAQVKWIVDGDTLVLENGKTVRYIGINAPETGHSGKITEPFGSQAKQVHVNLLKNRKIYLRYGAEKTDHYGRLLAYVYTQNGEFANRALLKLGAAYCLFRPPNIKHFALLLSAQREAMQQKRGVWSNLVRDDRPLVGNKRSYRFHKPGCAYGSRTRRSNRIALEGLWEAFWQGYAPCKRCFPSGVFVQTVEK